MSFSGEVKKELTEHVSKSRHCQLAELAAFLNFSGIKAGMGESPKSQTEATRGVQA